MTTICPYTGRTLVPPKSYAPLAVAPVSYQGPLWHVAMVETGGEIDAASDIHSELGFPVFVPAERVWTMRRGRRVQACKPLFEGYIFPQVHPYRQDWQRLLDVDGVIDVLGRPADDRRRPSYIPNVLIDALRRAQDAGVFNRTTAKPERFDLGETVRIDDGVFKGHNGVITEFVAKMRSATAKKRAKLLVQFMQRMVSTEVDVVALEKL